MGTSDFVDDKSQQKQKQQRSETREPSIKTETIVENIAGLSGKVYIVYVYK